MFVICTYVFRTEFWILAVPCLVKLGQWHITFCNDQEAYLTQGNTTALTSRRGLHNRKCCTNSYRNRRR